MVPPSYLFRDLYRDHWEDERASSAKPAKRGKRSLSLRTYLARLLGELAQQQSDCLQKPVRQQREALQVPRQIWRFRSDLLQ